MDLREQHLAAWADRRDSETRAMLATAQRVNHQFTGAGRCAACGGIGPHHDEATTEHARLLAGLPPRQVRRA